MLSKNLKIQFTEIIFISALVNKKNICMDFEVANKVKETNI